MYIITENKQFGNKKPLEYESFKKNSDISDLETMLILNLPNEIRAGREKAVKTAFKTPTKRALNKFNFISFNTQNKITVSILDFDWFDKKNKRTIKDQYPTIEIFKEFYLEEYDLEFKINVIVETNKGYQCLIFWENQIIRGTKAFKKLEHFKSGICETLENIDIGASKRNYGIWRNPLKHNHLVIDLVPKRLNEFEEFCYIKKEIEIEITEIKKTPEKSLDLKQSENVKAILKMVLQNEIIQIGEGLRKSVIFQFAMIKARSDKHNNFINLYNLVEEANNKYCYPSLSLSEIEEVCKSTINYTLQDKNLVKNPLNWGYEPTKTKDEIMATRLEHIENLAIMRKEENTKKILAAIEYLKTLGKKITARNIMEITKLSKNTMTVYKDLWKRKNEDN
jgi:hypothetical protein